MRKLLFVLALLSVLVLAVVHIESIDDFIIFDLKCGRNGCGDEIIAAMVDGAEATEKATNAALDRAIGVQVAQLDAKMSWDDTVWAAINPALNGLEMSTNVRSAVNAEIEHYIGKQLDPSTTETWDPPNEEICSILHQAADISRVPVDGICTGLGQ
ncbi:hypothetical protein KJ596_03100 [Patescibacteria group bacterium]|nr:hypothetical protein [Patescibacteria group bacterium]MBU1867836.1 hypothetical protein [Patescibacteria group bacterium]